MVFSYFLREETFNQLYPISTNSGIHFRLLQNNIIICFEIHKYSLNGGISFVIHRNIILILASYIMICFLQIRPA
jgi:hypothetical protein